MSKNHASKKMKLAKDTYVRFDDYDAVLPAGTAYELVGYEDDGVVIRVKGDVGVAEL